LFQGNVATGGGGGISVEKNAIVQMFEVQAENNIAFDPKKSDPKLCSCVPAEEDHISSGGFLHAIFAGPLVMRDTILKNNRADNNGGAIQIGATAGVFHNVIFENNTAKYGSGGGLSATGSSEIHLLESTLTQNTAPKGSGGHVAVSFSKFIVHSFQSAMMWPFSPPTFPYDQNDGSAHAEGIQYAVNGPTVMTGGVAKFGGSLAATGNLIKYVFSHCTTRY